jgi:hypothetical protein
MTEAEWLNAADPEILLRWLQKSKKHRPSVRKLQLFSCGCCREVWFQVADMRFHHAIEAAEQVADGLMTIQAAKALADRQFDSAGSFTVEFAPASWTFHLPWNTEFAPETSASAAAGYAIRLISARGRKLARERQSHILRDIIGNPYRRPASTTNWQTALVVSLAQAIYDQRAFDRMPILADALEDAGCTNTDVLSHCRQPGQHVRGCWVVDLLLGKK